MEEETPRPDHDDETPPRPLKRQKTIHPDWYYDHANHDEHQRSASWRYNMYTVAWICALPIEMATAQMMLDEEHEELPRLENDTNKYLLGRIKQHNVVIACLPHGSYGTINASSVSTHLIRSFPAVRTCLMVGIGGGAPNRADLRLGDVVVGQRVMQYDLGKQHPNGQVQHTAVAKLIPHALSTVVSALRARHEGSEHVLCVPQPTQQDNPGFSRPTDPDRLFQAGYQHVNSHADCSACDQSKLIPRRKRRSDNPMIHYGAIASGSLVIKDSVTRDKKANDLDVMCFEMESAGLMDSLDCLPIRGICDYSDSHKNKKWQAYAALTAAIYAKEFLHELPLAAMVHPSLPHSLGRSNTGVGRGDEYPTPDREPAGDRRQRFLESLEFKRIDERRMDIKHAHHKTCRWLLSHPDYKAWMDSSKLTEHHGFLWIRGKPGAGKSTIMKFIHRQMVAQTSKDKQRAAVASFFFHARGELLEKSVLGMYRSLLLQLFKAFPDLESVVDQSAIGSGTYDCKDLKFLKEIFWQAVEQLGHRSFTCFIDALDECDEQQVIDMVEHFEELAENSVDQGISLRICFSSRHYPYIEMRLGLRLVLEDQPGHTDDLSTYVQQKLHIKDPAVFEGLRSMILEKAAGVFLWVILVVDILNEENQRGRFSLKKRLEEIPSGLSELFEDILRRDTKNMDELLLCVLWVLYAKRPLKPAEYYHALWTGLHLNNADDFEMPDATASDVEDVIQNCVTTYSKGLVEIANSAHPVVQFIHESVRDFLVKERGLTEMWPELGYDWSIEGHDRLKKCCYAYINKVPSKKATDASLRSSTSLLGKEREESLQNDSGRYPFLEYACDCVFYHANEAADAISQGNFLSDFDLSKWISIHNKVEKRKARRHSSTTSILYIITERGCPELIRTWLQQDKNINVIGGRYNYPLFAALACRDIDSIVALLDLPQDDFNVDRIAQWTQEDAEKSFWRKTPLTWASAEGERNIAHQLLKNSLEIDEKDGNGETALLAALVNRQKDIALLLLEKGADWRSTTRHERTLLRLAMVHGYAKVVTEFKPTERDIDGVLDSRTLGLAAACGHLSTVKILLEAATARSAADTESARSLLNSALFSASRMGHATIVEAVIRAGRCTAYFSRNDGAVYPAVEKGPDAGVQLLMKEGTVHRASIGLKTSLMTAAKRSHWGVVRILMDAGAVAAATATELDQLLRNAADDGPVHLIRPFIEARANINAPSAFLDLPLINACRRGLEEMVNLLITKGANLNAVDEEGMPALHHVIKSGLERPFEVFVEKGVEIQSRDKDGWTALHHAAFHCRKRLGEALINKGADIDAKDHRGQRALHHAASRDHKKFVKALIDKGADIDAKDRCGRTALHYAASHGHERVIEALIDKGANIDAKDHWGQTALLLLLKIKYYDYRFEAAKMLIKAGADVYTADNRGVTALTFTDRHSDKHIRELLKIRRATNTDI